MGSADFLSLIEIAAEYTHLPVAVNCLGRNNVAAVREFQAIVRFTDNQRRHWDFEIAILAAGLRRGQFYPGQGYHFGD